MPKLLDNYRLEPVDDITAHADIYADGDHLGAVVSFSLVRFNEELSGAMIRGVSAVVEEALTPAFDVLFFNKTIAPTSSDNDAISITSAILKDAYIGKISLSSSDFLTTGGGNAVATVFNEGLPLHVVDGATAAFVLLVSRSADDYNASVIKLKIHLEKA